MYGLILLPRCIETRDACWRFPVYPDIVAAPGLERERAVLQSWLAEAAAVMRDTALASAGFPANGGAIEAACGGSQPVQPDRTDAFGAVCAYPDFWWTSQCLE
jgi:hypothetical protein